MLQQILHSRWTFVLGFAMLALFLLPTPARIGALVALTLTGVCLMSLAALERFASGEQPTAAASTREEAFAGLPGNLVAAEGRSSNG